MKQGAIVSLLWPRYHSVLTAFCQREPGLLVLTQQIYWDAATAATLEQLGSRLVTLESLLDEAADLRVHTDVNTVLNKLNGYFATLGWEDINKELATEEAVFAELVKLRADAEVPAQVRLLEALEIAQESLDIRLLVVSEDVTAQSKTAVIWSKRREVPSLQLMHGVALSKPYTVHSRLFTDRLAVYGQRGLESYVDIGVDPQQCYIVGNPAWDGYAGRSADRAACRASLAARHGLNPAKPWIVFATTWAAYLTALSDPLAFSQTLNVFLDAAGALREAGIEAEIIIKSRPGSGSAEDVAPLALAAGFAADDYCFAMTHTEDWVVAADVMVGADSNIQVEAMQVGTPVVNLLNWFGLRLGPSFDADSGVLEATEEELAPILAHLLASAETRAHLSAKLQAAAPRYNAGVDGLAGQRTAELMRQLLRPVEASQYIWQQLLDVAHIDATGYHDGRRPDLVDMFSNEPRLLLDIGCAAGGTGLYFKQKYPDARVWGIEMNEAAAAKATTRLDRVLVGKFEDFDLALEGIEPGTLDAVIVADVLEHMYNPWQVLTALKPLLSPRAQIVSSIPNVRNIGLMEDLAQGYWRYDSWGLLDITHIRFFTYKEMLRFYHETGYHVVRSVPGIDPRLANLYQLFLNKVPCDIDAGRMILKGVTADELAELCALQFYMLVEPGAQALDNYAPPALPAPQPADRYQRFLQEHRLSTPEANLFEARMAQWGKHPQIHIAIVGTEETLPALTTTISSLANQLYYAIRFTVLAPVEPPAEFVAGERFDWLRHDGNVHAGLNQLFASSSADWLTVLQCGDEVAGQAFLYLMEAAYSHPDWQLLYADEDRIDAPGRYEGPHFKPDFSPDYFYELPYIGDFYLISRPLFGQIGGYDLNLLGAGTADLLLRALEAVGEQGIGHVADVLYHRAAKRSLDLLPTDESLAAGRIALTDHFRRTGVAAEVEAGRLAGTYRVRYQHPDTPLVSIIIATREHLQDLQNCLESVSKQTSWPQMEILIVDTGSQDEATLAYLLELDSLNSNQLRVFHLPEALNLAHIRNLAADQAQGDYLLFLDNDVQAINADWLHEMMAEAQRPEVGVVGARLINGDETINEAGRILGLHGVANTPYRGHRFDAPGYFGRLQTVQNYSAVAASCMLVKKALYQQLGGMNEAFDLYHADHDFCLRVGEAGLRVLWTPYANLYHKGGSSLCDPALISEADRSEREEQNRALLYEKWLPRLSNDPAYNRNLSLQNEPFHIEPRLLLTKQALSWKPLPRLLSMPGDSAGCGNYRVMQPQRAAYRKGLIDGWSSFDHYSITEIGRVAPDTIVLQRQMMDHQLPFLREYKRHYNAKLVFETDDLFTDVPSKSLHRPDVPRQLDAKLRNALAFCDRFIVSTEPLKQAFGDFHPDIRVVKNSMDFTIWGDLKPKRRAGRKPRVGWAGGMSHSGDLEIIYDVVRELADEVDWIFFGMCPEPIKQYIKEVPPGVGFDDYPAALASLNLDLALAPLEYNAFNECKSNLRILEYGILGYPMVATDILPYQGDYPITLVPNDPARWVAAIREHLADLDATARQGDKLRQYVIDHWLLDDHLPEWMAAWFEF
ncbi:glycosyltransferase [Chitinimonas arctica]|uniref:Glycosyltransferase n=1 Tax=Chitinimonas arctica TaxID=2594795 RepID=A0A516SL70_9NEIS|nr:glycosyltransferase [Chitinimonas arctica]QDQ28911.1 glycosyltransferase [Chitinimonas arctica]